jgi:aminoglycoside phosphotransferase (APT) family kinase protein
MTSLVTAFLARRWCVPESSLHLEVQPLKGGLESVVSRARVDKAQVASRVPRDLVVKQVSSPFAREADVYDALWSHLERPPAVEMFGREVHGDATYLYLEYAESFSSWPWSDTALSACVCRELARLHDARSLSGVAFPWNYEDELIRSAEDTLRLAATARDPAGQRVWRRPGDLRRVVRALPRIRRRLLSQGAILIHGDTHPGNVILRRSGESFDVLLIDWARARLGSPLEDVASWLHSVGCWEPQARRRHDTLMRTYLEARHVPCAFNSELRVDYWFASVSNGLSGAIRYHLAVLGDPAATRAGQTISGVALVAWERVVRRAAALVNTSLDR